MSENEELEEFKRLNTLIDTYTESLRIDKNDLDTALVEQANIFNLVGIAYAECISSRDFSKNQLDRIKAEVDRYLREDAQRENTRLTEAQVANLINEDKSYQTAYSNYLTWKTLAEKWLALRESYSQRLYVLRDLVQLYGSDYFQRSTLTAEKVSARDRMAADVRARIADKRKERLVS